MYGWIVPCVQWQEMPLCIAESVIYFCHIWTVIRTTIREITKPRLYQFQLLAYDFNIWGCGTKKSSSAKRLSASGAAGDSAAPAPVGSPVLNMKCSSLKHLHLEGFCQDTGHDASPGVSLCMRVCVCLCVLFCLACVLVHDMPGGGGEMSVFTARAS